VTLQRAAPNLFRFSADHGQGVAGLATYAYRELGWRRVAIVLGNWDVGWSGRDAFTAEFCALGGSVESLPPVDEFDPEDDPPTPIPAAVEDVDGVAVFVARLFGPAGFMQRLARRVDDPARRIVVGPGLTDDPALLRESGRALDGVVGSSNTHPGNLDAYLRSFARAFPGVQPDVAAGEQVSGYRDAVEAALRGLEQADADPARLPDVLQRLRVDLIGGRVQLDANRQAVTTTSLVRIGGGTTLRSIAGVDQSIGGLLAPSATPNYEPAGCRRGQQAPPWAR
jgi:branched-chain amino acid transport system substrate-binding protein